MSRGGGGGLIKVSESEKFYNTQYPSPLSNQFISPGCI